MYMYLYTNIYMYMYISVKDHENPKQSIAKVVFQKGFNHVHINTNINTTGIYIYLYVYVPDSNLPRILKIHTEGGIERGGSSEIYIYINIYIQLVYTYICMCTYWIPTCHGS